jgi:hypoxanthine-guanine phosphoribosyltransferase
MRVLFSAAEIAAGVDTLAAEIARTIPGDFVMVGLLKGAVVFVADLPVRWTERGPGRRSSSCG